MQLQRATRLLEGYRSTHWPRRNWRASGCWVAGPAPKAGMKKGIRGPLSFLQKKQKKTKHFQVSKLLYTALVQLRGFQTPGTTQFHHEETLLGRGDHLNHHLLQCFNICLLTCILRFRWRWLHIFLHSGTIQWAGSILDLYNKLKTLQKLKFKKKKPHFLHHM